MHPGDDAQADGADRPYYGQDRLEMDQMLPASAVRILEVGCGDGRFLERSARRLGSGEAWGVEYDSVAAEAAIGRGLDIICGSYPEAVETLQGTFDLVVFNDVLEHLVDPWTALERTKELLTGTSTVVVSLPNIANIATLNEIAHEGDFRYRSSGVLDETHLRFFTRRSATRMFESSGYTVSRVVPIAPVSGWRLAGAARMLARLPPVKAKDLGFKQLAFSLRLAD